MSLPEVNYFLANVTEQQWKAELENSSYNFHQKVLWVAAIFDPVFAITDYFNLPQAWQLFLAIRLSVSLVTIAMLLAQKKFGFSIRINVALTFLLISVQNAFTYHYLGTDDLLGQNLNYMALFIGAAMFIVWEWWYSVVIVLLSAVATTLFVVTNHQMDISQFFVKGGLLLAAVAIFMVILIRTRYDLLVKEIKSRLALNASNEAIKQQAEEIKSINENLESLVRERTRELEKKNKALEEYAFINAHKLRAPVASILGLIPIFNSFGLRPDEKEVLNHLKQSTLKLDEIVHSITQAIEQGDTQLTTQEFEEKVALKKLDLHHVKKVANE